MKKLLSTIMALVMLLSLVPMAVAEEGKTLTEANSEAQINDQYYETLADAVLKVANGDTIKLVKDVTVSSPVTIPAGKEFTLDLGGKTLTNNSSTKKGGTAITNNGTLTVVNGTIKSEMNNGIVAGSNSKTTIEPGVTVEAQECAVAIVDATGAEIIINGGKFTTVDNSVVSSNGSDRQGEANKITINGGTFTGNIKSSGYVACGIYAPWKDIITVNDGTFIVNNGIGVVCRAGQVYINGGTFICNGSAKGKVGDKNFDMDAAQALYFDNSNPPYPGYTAATDGIFVKGGAFTDLASAVKYAENGATITLAGDAPLTEKLTINKNVAIDLNGHAITNASTYTKAGYLIEVAADAVVSIVGDKAGSAIEDTRSNETGTITTVCVFGELTLDGSALSISRAGKGCIAVKVDCGREQGKLTINNGTITAAQAVQNWGIATINGGTFDGDVDAYAFTYKGETVAGDLTIKDGTFNEKVYASQLKYDGIWAAESAKVTIVGGVFNGELMEYYSDGTHGLQPVERVDKPADVAESEVVVFSGVFGADPTAFLADESLIAVPSKGGVYVVQPKEIKDGDTTTKVDVSDDGKTVTVTETENKTEGNVTTNTETVTVKDDKGNVTKVTEDKTETVKDEAGNVVAETVTNKVTENGKTTENKTETKTEKKTEGNVTTNTTTVTNTKTEDGKVAVSTETVTTEKTENGGKTTVVTKKDTLNKTETTEVTGVTAPTTASDVTLDVNNTTSVEVNKASMSTLTGDTVKDVIIKTEQATLKLDKTAVKTMEGNVAANGKMTLNVTVTEEKNATTTDIEKVKVEVTAKNEAGQNVFPENTANTNGKITITIPYKDNAKYLDLWYVAANGSASYMGRFPVVKGFVSFDVKHFSQYDLIPVASSGSSVIKTGTGSSAASTTQTVTTDLTPGSITKVTVDGKVVDAKYYTVSGSNVTFTAEFLKTLKNGSHTVTVENATKIAKGVFTVNNPTTAQSPTTADAGIALYAGMAIASVMGTGVVFTSRKRKNH